MTASPTIAETPCGCSSPTRPARPIRASRSTALAGDVRIPRIDYTRIRAADLFTGCTLGSDARSPAPNGHTSADFDEGRNSVSCRALGRCQCPLHQPRRRRRNERSMRPAASESNPANPIAGSGLAVFGSVGSSGVARARCRRRLPVPEGPGGGAAAGARAAVPAAGVEA